MPSILVGAYAGQDVHDRRFGVEIEHNSGGRGTRGTREALLNPSLGLAHWFDDEYALGYDGSELELRSPILQGERGFDELRRVFDVIKSGGGFVTQSDGMHVHHDCPEFTEDSDAGHELRSRLVESWANNQNLIDSFVHESRWNSWACSKTFNKVNGSLVERYKQDKQVGSYYGRGALNVDALWEHGTVEFRQHEGTLDFDMAEAWIKFGQAFIASVLHRSEPITTSASPRTLLSRIHVPKSCADYLIAKNPHYEISGGYCEDCGYEDDCHCDLPYCDGCNSYVRDCGCGGGCIC